MVSDHTERTMITRGRLPHPLRSLIARLGVPIHINIRLNLSRMLHHSLRQVIILLQIRPEVGTIAKEPRQPKRRVPAISAPPMHDPPNTRRRHANLQRQFVLANSKRLQKFLEQHHARMSRRCLEIPLGSGSHAWHSSYFHAESPAKAEKSLPELSSPYQH
jgi:hypothetical protein